MDVLQELTLAGAVSVGVNHYVYKSGKHGDAYINMDYLFPHAGFMEQLCLLLGEPFNGQFDTVIGAATGGIPLAVLTAQQSSAAQSLWADKSGDDFEFARAGFGPALYGRDVLVVEDLLNTGDTTRKVIAQARKWEAHIVGVSVVCNRGSETARSLGVPRLEALSHVDMQAFDAEDCLQCAEGQPIVTDVGHGDKFQEHHPNYSGGFTKILQ